MLRRNMSAPAILADSRVRYGAVKRYENGVAIVDYYCCSCGAVQGEAPEAAIQKSLFVLCGSATEGCMAKYGHQAFLSALPDEVYFAKFAEAQLEEVGHYVGPAELDRILDDVNHPLAKLAREYWPELR